MLIKSTDDLVKITSKRLSNILHAEVATEVFHRFALDDFLVVIDVKLKKGDKFKLILKDLDFFTLWFERGKWDRELWKIKSYFTEYFNEIWC